MAKYGINISIDVSKIDKSQLYKGKKGNYLSLTTFVDVDNKGEFGDNGMVKQDWQGADSKQTPILGNAKVFWSDGGQPQQPKQRQVAPKSEPDIDFDDDIPF